jgi:hypothetical protein
MAPPAQMALACDNIRTSVRHLTSIVVVNFALLLAFMQAPSLHIHPHETAEPHEAGFLHTHVAHFEAPLSNQPEWRDLDPDDEPQFLNWFLTSPTDWRFTPVILTTSKIVLPLPEVSEWRTVMLKPSAHDPSALNATRPRAPPV